MPSFECEGASVRRPGRAVLVAAGVMLVPHIGFAFVAAGAPQAVRSAVGIVAVFEAFALLAVALLLPRVIWGAGKPHATRVVVDERGLVLDGRLAMARRDVSSVSVASGALDSGHAVVAGRHHLSTIVLDLGHADVARALAVALDADVSLPTYLLESEPLVPGRRWRRALSRAAVAVPMFALAVFVVHTRVRQVVPVGYLPLVIAFFFALFRGGAPTRAALGADGIALRRRGADPRFVPFAAIATVDKTERGADLVLTSGERLALCIAGSDPSTDAQAATLASALQAAHQDVVRAERDEATERRLERAERSTHDWLSEVGRLRSHASTAQGYRALSLGEDRLLALVESPLAASSARAAAVMVVAPMLNEVGRSRLRATAVRTATPGLRDVIEATLREADDDELEALLEAQS